MSAVIMYHKLLKRAFPTCDMNYGGSLLLEILSGINQLKI